MKAILDNLNKRCKEALEEAAYDAYQEERTETFETAKTTVSLKNASFELNATKLGNEILFEVEIDHNRDLENIVEEIVNYLERNCDPENAWDTAYFEDMDKACDTGCDPAFPHYGDYESYRYRR